MGIVKLVKPVYIIKQSSHPQPKINIILHPPPSSEVIPHPPSKHQATTKYLTTPSKLLLHNNMRPIYTNKIHNSISSHQNNTTKTFQGFNGSKLLLPDGANASKNKLVCSFDVSNIFSLEWPIKELVVPIKLVSSRSFNDPLLLANMSNHYMILCGAISRHGIFTSPSFDSNSSRDLICSTYMVLNYLTCYYMCNDQRFSLF